MKEPVEKPLKTRIHLDSFSRSLDNLHQLSHVTRLLHIRKEKTSHVFIRVQVQNSESDEEKMRISVVV